MPYRAASSGIRNGFAVATMGLLKYGHADSRQLQHRRVSEVGTRTLRAVLMAPGSNAYSSPLCHAGRKEYMKGQQKRRQGASTEIPGLEAKVRKKSEYSLSARPWSA